MEDRVISLHIELQDGFEDDTVVIKVYNNGNQIFDKTQAHVTTNLAISLARDSTGQYSIFQLTKIQSGEVEVKVNIPSKHLADGYKFIINSRTYLAISIAEREPPNKKIMFVKSNEPFPHL
jgi:hypothetical protein